MNEESEQRTALFTAAIKRFDSLPSTNLEVARRASQGAAEGLCVVSAEQTQGRGRLGREWTSPKGAGLYFSILLRPTLPQRSWPLLTLMTAIAVQDALSKACDLQTDIKWPNDIIANDGKLCGILAETAETPNGLAVVIGVGINLTQKSFPSELAGVATSVEDATGVAPDLDIVLDHLVEGIAKQYETLQRPSGASELVKNWCARSSYCSGKRIRVTDGTNSFIGTTMGIEEDGALIVEVDNGERKVIRAGDISNVRPLENDSRKVASE
jgi:BirA family biotin operon repressor/biotin-[acetyl-CoA-carboxylase] ligase